MSNKDFMRDIAFNASRYAKEKEYWLNKLSGRLVRSSFPYDFNKMAEGQRDEIGRPLERMEFKISGGVFEKLMWTVNNSDLRLFMILVAGLMVLLGKHTGQEDILVGAPIERQEVEGNFLNTILALRAQLDAGITFKELLLQVRQAVVDAGENQNFPIDRIPYELNMDVHENEAFALFDTAILLENLHDRNYIAHIPLNIVFSFLRTAESIKGVVEYNPALYKKETVQGITGHFVHLFQETVSNLDIPIIKLNIMPENEREFLLVKMNDTRAEYPNATIHELFEIQVEKTPGRNAVEEADTGQTMTYNELNQRANQLANLLKEKGANPGAVVAVMGERTGDMVTSILAILKAGGVFLPLDAQNPDERLHFILEDSGANIVISQKRIIAERGDLFKGFFSKNSIVMDDEGIYNHTGNQSQENLHIAISPMDPGYIIYTSGTTGKPKGVMVEHKSLVNYIHFAINNYVKGEAVNFPFYTSIAFDLTITSIFTPLVTGNAVVVYSGWNKGNLIERIVDDNKVGVVKLTPSHLYLIGEKKLMDSPGKVRRFVVGGEVLKYQLARNISDNFNGKVEIYNEYGPTEATVGCMLYKFTPGKDNGKGSSVSIGVPAANAQIYLLDKNREPVPMGAVGEIHIGGDGLARGYLNNPELTAERFIFLPNFLTSSLPRFHLYCTGDLARWVNDGNIEFLGRIDQQVKIRGFRIELGEIESQLLKHEEVKEAVVIIKEAVGDKHICTYIVSGRELSVSELREYLTGRLPDYMIPSYFVCLDAIPLTSNGKIDIKALPEPETKTEAVYIAPRDETEKKLVGIWSEILGVEAEHIGIDSNFFELGGHSLSGTVLTAKIHKSFNVKLALVDLFRLPTVRELAQLLKKSVKIDFISIEPVEEKEYYPLSSAQERLFIIQQMDPDSIGYNVPIVYEIQGRLIMEKLQDVFRKLIHRHDNLRTSFILIADKPIQWIHKQGKFEIEYSDLSEVEPNLSREAEIIHIIRSFVRPFDLSCAPLLRVKLIRINQSSHHHILMMDIHHIITDGVSMDILIKEIGALYIGYQLAPLKLHYKDFSEWQNSVKIKEEMKKQEAYWLKQFEGEIPLLKLPTDFPRPLVQSFEGDRIHIELNDSEVAGLKDLATAQGGTLFMVILSLYNIFLSKVSGQEDIIVGTPLAGRRHADLEYVLGIFINTLALRNYPDGEKSFLEFLQEIKISTLDAYENQEYQYEDLVSNVQVGRDTSRNPLLDTMFALNNVNTHYLNIPQFEIPDLKIIPNKSDFLISKMDILLDGFDDSKNISFNLEYSTRLFKKETILVFLRYFRQVIASVLANPGQKIWEIEILSNEEKKHLLFDFNDTVTDFPADSTIHQVFQEQVERIPNNIAVVGPFANQIHIVLQLTYNELNERANQLAHVLREKSVKPDSIVTIMMERSVEMMIGIIGILKSGGAYLPIDPSYPQERIDYMLKDSNAAILLTDKKEINCQLSIVNCQLSMGDPRAYLHHSSFIIHHSNHLAYIIYTSGTTGKAKAAAVMHGGVVNYICWRLAAYGFRENDVTLQLLSYTFDGFGSNIYSSFFSGGKLVIIPESKKLDFSYIADLVNITGVTNTSLTPGIYATLLDASQGKQLESLRFVVLAGEKSDADLIVKNREKMPQVKLYNEYGPTETTITATANLQWDISETVAIGKPIANVRIYIIDKNDLLSPIGIPGQLAIAGIGLARGYLNNPELTAEKFRPLMPLMTQMKNKINKSFAGVKGELFQKLPLVIYKTGDLARWLTDGNIEFLGRIDRQVKIRGYRIELGEIEKVLSKHDIIKETVVVSGENENGSSYLCAYIVCRNEPIVSELREYLGKQLPEYMIPSHFVKLEKIPLTINGKIDRKSLPIPGSGRPDIDIPYSEPVSELEKEIAEIWMKVLNYDKVGIYDKFFDIGGTSIKAVQIIALLNKKLKRKIPVLAIFEHPTIASFSTYLNPGKAENILSSYEDESYGLEKREESLQEAMHIFEDN